MKTVVIFVVVVLRRCHFCGFFMAADFGVYHSKPNFGLRCNGLLNFE